MKYKAPVAGLMLGSAALGVAGCASESAYTGLGAIVQNNSFGKYVTRKVVMNAVDDFLDDLSRSVEYNYRPTAGLASYRARAAALRQAMGRRGYERYRNDGVTNAAFADSFGIPYDPELVQRRQEVMEAARSFLRDPVSLMSAYLTYKRDVVNRIRERRLTEPVREFLEEMLNGEDADAIGLAERRREEGGDGLVEMWRLIIGDLRASL